MNGADRNTQPTACFVTLDGETRSLDEDIVHHLKCPSIGVINCTGSTIPAPCHARTHSLTPTKLRFIRRALSLGSPYLRTDLAVHYIAYEFAPLIRLESILLRPFSTRGSSCA